jgi:hypothetical protein
MRRFDKRTNIIKANLLAEQRYLESKGLIKEEENTKSTIQKPEDLDKLIISAFSGDNLGFKINNVYKANVSNHYQRRSDTPIIDFSINVYGSNDDFYIEVESEWDEDPDGLYPIMTFEIIHPGIDKDYDPINDELKPETLDFVEEAIDKLINQIYAHELADRV